MFITIEGIEGSGKSTLAKNLANKIEVELLKDVVLTREPGASELGKKLRELLLRRETFNTVQTAELLMFGADRAQHIHEVIQPSLENGSVVISDRYIHSTLAYQGHGRGIDFEMLKSINQIATGGLIPELVIVMDLEATKGLARAKQRGEDSWTSFEREEIAFHEKIRNAFLHFAKEQPEMFAVIDANKSPEEILEIAFAEIKTRISSSTSN